MPSGGLLGTSVVESGKAAPLVGGPPSCELHTTVDGLPTGDAGDIVPVVLRTIGVGMVPNAIPGIIVVDDIVEVDEVIAVVLPAVELEIVLGAVDDTGGTSAGLMEG